MPLEYWFGLGVLTIILTLFVHLRHTGRVPWQVRVLATVLGLIVLTFPFTAFSFSTGVDALHTQEQTVKRACLDLQSELTETGCQTYNGSLAVTVGDETFDCADRGIVPPTLCQDATQK